MLKVYIKIFVVTLSLLSLGTFCMAQNQVNGNRDYADKKFSVSINALYSYQYGLRGDYYINTSLIDVVSKARNGFGFLVDAHLALNKKRSWFLGIEYGNIQGYGSANNITLVSQKSATVYKGNLDLYIRTRLIGLNMMLALAKKNPKHCVYFVLGVSQSKYNEEFFIDGKNSSCNTSDLILTYGFKYDKRIGKHLALSSGIILNQAAVRYVLANENLLENKGTLLGGDRVDFGKINFSLGLRYYLGRKL